MKENEYDYRIRKINKELGLGSFLLLYPLVDEHADSIRNIPVILLRIFLQEFVFIRIQAYMDHFTFFRLHVFEYIYA